MFQHMEVLRFIFFLGIIYITFDAIWRIFLALLNITLGISARNSRVYYLSKSIFLYLLVSLTAITTNLYLELIDDRISNFFFPLIGLIVLYFYITSSMQRSKLKAQLKMDTVAMKRMKYNGIFIIVSLVYFLVSLNLPIIHHNPLTDWVFGFIESIYDMLVFRWIIGFFAVIFLINMLVKGYSATKYLITGFLGIRKPATNGVSDRIMDQNGQGDDIEDISYEIVDEEQE